MLPLHPCTYKTSLLVREYCDKRSRTTTTMTATTKLTSSIAQGSSHDTVEPAFTEDPIYPAPATRQENPVRHYCSCPSPLSLASSMLLFTTRHCLQLQRCSRRVATSPLWLHTLCQPTSPRPFFPPYSRNQSRPIPPTLRMNDAHVSCVIQAPPP